MASGRKLNQPAKEVCDMLPGVASVQVGPLRYQCWPNPAASPSVAVPEGRRTAACLPTACTFSPLCLELGERPSGLLRRRPSISPSAYGGSIDGDAAGSNPCRTGARY